MLLWRNAKCAPIYRIIVDLYTRPLTQTILVNGKGRINGVLKQALITDNVGEGRCA